MLVAALAVSRGLVQYSPFVCSPSSCPVKFSVVVLRSASSFLLCRRLPPALVHSLAILPNPFLRDFVPPFVSVTLSTAVSQRGHLPSSRSWYVIAS